MVTPVRKQTSLVSVLEIYILHTFSNLSHVGRRSRWNKKLALGKMSENFTGKKRMKGHSTREKSTWEESNYPQRGAESKNILGLTSSHIYLPVLPPLCFLQADTLPWLLLLLLPLTFAPCCSGRTAACLPVLPPSAAAVTALCSWEEVNEWAIARELTADWRLCDSWLWRERDSDGRSVVSWCRG